jgi:AcrR family transcriptional regulator
MPGDGLAPEVDAPKGARRAASKAATRRRVLDAAREMFLTIGFEETKLRDVAERAGVSVGSVFTTFDSKVDLFDAVFFEEYVSTADVMRAADDPQLGVRARLSAIFRAAYERHLGSLDLVRAGHVASWSRTVEGDRRNREALRPFLELLAALLAECAAKGEIDSGCNPLIAAEMMIELYLSSMRRAIYGGWALERLTARFDAELALLLRGLRSQEAA